MPLLFAGLLPACGFVPAVGEFGVAGVWLVTGGVAWVALLSPAVLWAKAMDAAKMPKASSKNVRFIIKCPP
jgi:hypothetical protein